MEFIILKYAIIYIENYLLYMHLNKKTLLFIIKIMNIWDMRT